MQLTKHHGLANDFLVALDEVNGSDLDLDGDVARRLCDRRTGLGADGLIHGARPDPSDPARADVDVVMTLFNADGSRAEMSGNGIRCLGQALALAREVREGTFEVATDAGRRSVTVREGVDGSTATVSVSMGAAGTGPDVPGPLAESIDGRFATVDMGNPHLVILVDEPSTIDLESEGAWLEQQFPGGINIEFIAVPSPDVVELAVWERGAGVTQACGTGACASAHVAHSWGLVGTRVRVEMPGGSAEVQLPDTDAESVAGPGALEPTHDIVLIGPAQLIGTIEVADADDRVDEALEPDLIGDDLAVGDGLTDDLPDDLTDDETHRGAFGDYGGESTGLIDRTFRERIVLVGVTLPPNHEGDTERSLNELALLVDTAGADVVDRIIQQRHSPDAATYLGSGKVAELKEICELYDADTVVFDDELSPAQQRNLEKLLGRTAIDRTAVILDIFAQNASSLEGKAQVELAQLRYLSPRLRGKGKSLSQQAGGLLGTRGPGETKLEVDRRRLQRRVHKLEADLRAVGKVRDNQAKARRQSRLHTVAIVGYTNAGKSTLLNRLTDAGVLVEDRLFATLDAATRRLSLPGGETVLLSDTVGFITKLPHQLVEAFKTTLEVAVDADLLVHVVDGSGPEPASDIMAVDDVLAEIGAGKVPQLLVVNKADLDPVSAKRLAASHPGSVVISAHTGEGIDELLKTIGDLLRALTVEQDLLIPYDRGDVLASLHREGEVLSETATDAGMHVRVRLDDAAASRVSQFTAIA